MFSTNYYKIDRTVFFNSVKFEDKNSLLNSLRTDWARMDISINTKKFKNYYNNKKYKNKKKNLFQNTRLKRI